MSQEPQETVPEIPREPKKRSRPRSRLLTRQQKLRYFLVGFLGWWLVNVPLALILDHVPGDGGLAIFVFPAQIILLIVMAFANRPVALGLVAAIGLNLMISTFLGLAFNMLCWIPFTTPLPNY